MFVMDFSFIVPVYNTPVELVEECLQSLFKLDPKIEFEIILVDDGSRREISSRLREIADGDRRVQYFYQQNKGVSSARNAGILAAKGKFISFVDSDDTMVVSVLEQPAKYEKYDLVLFNMEILENGISREVRAIDGRAGVIEMRSIVMQLATSSSLNGVCARLFRREWLQSYGIHFNERLITGEDVDFMIQNLRGEPKVYYTDRCFYRYNKAQDTYFNRSVTHADQILDYYFWNSDHIKELICKYRLPRRELFDLIDSANLQGLFQMICDLVYAGKYSDHLRRKIMALYNAHFRDIWFRSRKVRMQKNLIQMDSAPVFRAVASLRRMYLRHGVHFK